MKNILCSGQNQIIGCCENCVLASKCNTCKKQYTLRIVTCDNCNKPNLRSYICKYISKHSKIYDYCDECEIKLGLN